MTSYRLAPFCPLVLLACLPLVHAGCTSCIVEGTRIATPSGDCRIEDLRVGDDMSCLAPAGDTAVGRVVAKREAWSDAYVALTVDGLPEAFAVTASHPLATPDGWRPAGELRVGDKLSTRDGPSRVLDRREVRGRVRVYDLTVEPHPNFLAGGVWVHNKTVMPPLPDVPPPVERLTGVWLGRTNIGYRLCKLELRPDGTGTFARAPAAGPVERQQEVRWTFRRRKRYEYDVVVELPPTPDHPKRVTLSGELRPDGHPQFFFDRLKASDEDYPYLLERQVDYVAARQKEREFQAQWEMTR